MKLLADNKIGDGQRALRLAGCDDFEIGLLSVIRHLNVGLDLADPMAWRRAYEIASERWGDAIGLPAAHALMKLMMAVHDCREDAFQTRDPLCLKDRECITDDEVHLIAMLHYMRRDRTAAAREAVEDVTQGLMDPHVIRAGLAFAHRFSAGQGTDTSSSRAPKLTIVG